MGFLEHLTQRLIGAHGPASVLIVFRRRRFTISNVFFSKTTLPIKVKFYMEPPWEGGTKVCINGLGHMTKMAAIPIHTLKNFSRTRSPMILKLGMQYLELKFYKVYINNNAGLTLTYFTARSNLVTSMGKSENSEFFRNY